MILYVYYVYLINDIRFIELLTYTGSASQALNNWVVFWRQTAFLLSHDNGMMSERTNLNL